MFLSNLFNYRYGQRTVQGVLNDGWNALARYYLNNFVDGTKQVGGSTYILYTLGNSTSTEYRLFHNLLAGYKGCD